MDVKLRLSEKEEAAVKFLASRINVSVEAVVSSMVSIEIEKRIGILKLLNKVIPEDLR